MTTLSNIFIEITLDFIGQDKTYGEEYLKDIVKKQAQILYRQHDL